ncbi:hypothetical protein Tco_1408800 [Tanacetum coccineum]
MFKFGELQIELTREKAYISAAIGFVYAIILWELNQGIQNVPKSTLQYANDNALLIAKSLRGTLLVVFYGSAILSGFATLGLLLLSRELKSGNKSPEEEKDEAHISDTAREIRDVFGESDDEEPADYDAAQTNVEDDTNVLRSTGYGNVCKLSINSERGVLCAFNAQEMTCQEFHWLRQIQSEAVNSVSSSVLTITFCLEKPQPIPNIIKQLMRAGAATAIINIGKTRADNFADLKINARLEEICFRTTILIEPPIYLNPEYCSLLLMHRYYQGFSLAHLVSLLSET